MSTSAIRDRLHQAVTLRTEGRGEEARQILRELLKSAPHDPILLYQMAWTCDSLGAETEAVPYYEQALQLGLQGPERRGALLGLGSTLRCLGRYDQALEVLEEGRLTCPPGHEFVAFAAMVKYNLGHPGEAMGDLLRTLAETSSDEHVRSYGRALRFYADHLDEKFL
jgi:tetratricopeptide (TPR) repeat protein